MHVCVVCVGCVCFGVGGWVGDGGCCAANHCPYYATPYTPLLHARGTPGPPPTPYLADPHATPLAWCIALCRPAACSFAYVAAYCVSPFGSAERAWKPFNPILGEARAVAVCVCGGGAGQGARGAAPSPLFLALEPAAVPATHTCACAHTRLDEWAKHCSRPRALCCRRDV